MLHGFKRKIKQTKTNFLKSKVLSINDMLWHVYMLNSVHKENLHDIHDITVDEMREYLRINKENLSLSAGNIIILLTFSNNYLSDCAEVLSALKINSYKLYNPIKALYKSSTSNTGRIKLLKEKDKDGIKTKIGKSVINTNYLLLSGNVSGLIGLYENINSLSNPILQEISNIIYNNIDYTLFETLIDDKVLELDKFKSFYEPLIIARNYISISDSEDIYIADYDNVDNILPLLPPVFLSIDLVDMINITINSKYNCGVYLDSSLYSIISQYYHYSNSIQKVVKLIDNSKIYYDNIIKGVYKIEDMIVKVLEPVYKRDDDSNLIVGKSEDVDEDYINEIKGANVYSPLLENQTELVDIDEELSEDDPEYNQIDEELKK